MNAPAPHDRPRFLDALGRDLAAGRRALLRRRRRTLLAGSAAAVALVAGAVAIAVSSREDPASQIVTDVPSTTAPPATTAPPSTTAPPATTARSTPRTGAGAWLWQPIPAFAPGSPHVVAWMGAELFLWDAGGARAVDVDTGATRALADPPVPAPDRYADTATVWTGDELVLWLIADDPAEVVRLAYSPGADSWDTLPPAPGTLRFPVASVWTGREILYWGDSFRRGAATAEGWAYDPAAASWRRIADAPLGLNLGNAVWTGDEMVVVAAELDGNNGTITPTQVLRYDPDRDAWATGAPPPLVAQSAGVAWTGSVLVGWDYGLGAARSGDRGETWTPLPEIPLDSGECYVAGTAIGGDAVFVYCGQFAALDPVTDTWTAIPAPFIGGAVVGEDRVALVADDRVAVLTRV